MGLIKILALSDTHGSHIPNLPKADILIHAGDWSSVGVYQDTLKLLRWIKDIRHRYKAVCVVPGNHDLWVEANIYQATKEFADIDAHLLINSSINVCGLNVHGNPWCPEFGSWAFMAPLDKRKQCADAIPDDTDILITHSPPLGYLDKLAENGSKPGTNVGCAALTAAIYRVQPKAAICGHIHEGSGITMMDKTPLINAAHRDEYYKPTNAYKIIYV